MRWCAREIAILLLCIDCVMTRCQFSCASCSASICSRCKLSYMLINDWCYPCSSYCNGCDGYNCNSCVLGRWGDTCYDQCPTNCLYGCQQENGYCYRCKDGFYGQKCNEDCSRCTNERCGLRKCEYGCKFGYYEYRDIESTTCKLCSWKCKSCKSETECTACNDGFFLYQYKTYAGRNVVYCTKCSLTIPACQIYCQMPNCNDCHVQSGSLVCTNCNPGYIYNGGECNTNRSTVCSEGCFGRCDVSGICLSICKDGYTGERCLEYCASQWCVRCSKYDGKFCKQCKDDYFTRSCKVACPSSCSKIEGRQTCEIDDGYCLNGCDHNFWGYFCNRSCSNGCADENVTEVCIREDGKCTHGCKDGFTGYKCEMTITTTTPAVQSGSSQTDVERLPPTHAASGKVSSTLSTLKASSTDLTTRSRTFSRKSDELKQGQNKTIIIGSAAGGGVVLLILLSVVIFCFAKRRRKSKRRSKDSVKRNEKHIKVVQNDEALQPERISETQDYIYAKPIKSRKHQNKRETENQRQKSNYNVSINVDVDQVTVEETDVDAIVLEELEDGINSFIETDVTIPTTDVYYNTAGLIRSRIQVTSLLDYVKTKTDFETEFEKLPKGLTRPCNEALRPNNRLKNRFNGIYAYDATRVVLQSKDFINANYIDGHKLSPAYIASLGPTQSTMHNFATCWEMIWQEKIDKIIMLTNLEERKKMKCEQYWPKQGTDMAYGDYKVKCNAEQIFSEFAVRDFEVVRGSQIRRVTQYHYTAWPDKTVPDNVVSLLEFRDKVEQTQTKGSGLVMVHCSAGIGRTGTYIALDILIKEGREEGSVDIFGCVNALRGQRVQMVQNVEQYVYLHHCVLYALTCDAEPFPVTAVPHYMTDERILAQHQAFVNMQQLVNGEKTKIKSRNENRKGADIPGENHRVRLTLTKRDYINAVYLNGYRKVNKFIVAQTPLSNTLEDFVSMLYQEKCACVVCLDEENVLNKSVAQYLPPANKVSTFGHFQVACMCSDQSQDFVIRELKISRIGSPLSEELSVSHYQFKSWGSTNCVPPRTLAFLKMVMDVDKTMQRLNCKQPIVVHCTTGAERSGLYCAVSILLEKVAVEKELSVLNTIYQVCSRRNSAFRDIEHLRFCYNCVEEMLEMSDTNTYYNIGNV